jgi:hypothetical protein
VSFDNNPADDDEAAVYAHYQQAGMTNAKVVAHLREWVKQSHMPFAWPTDGCGYGQHIRFVEHRNTNWHGEQKDFNQFVLDYADMLEKEHTP